MEQETDTFGILSDESRGKGVCELDVFLFHILSVPSASVSCQVQSNVHPVWSFDTQGDLHCLADRKAMHNLILAFSSTSLYSFL